MNIRNFTIAISIAALITSCSKEDMITGESSVAGLAATSATFISGWEKGYSWSSMDSSDFKIFYYGRSMPQLTADVLNSSVVLVWLKNVPYDGVTVVDKPMLVPFAVMPPNGVATASRPAYEQVWYLDVVPGRVTIKYRTNRHHFVEGPILAPDARVEARYFILSDDDLRNMGHTEKSIRQLTYSQFLQAVGAH